MLRFFCRRKVIFPCIAVTFVLSSLFTLILDDTFDVDDHYHPRAIYTKLFQRSFGPSQYLLGQRKPLINANVTSGKHNSELFEVLEGQNQLVLKVDKNEENGPESALEDNSIYKNELDGHKSNDNNINILGFEGNDNENDRIKQNNIKEFQIEPKNIEPNRNEGNKNEEEKRMRFEHDKEADKPLANKLVKVQEKHENVGVLLNNIQDESRLGEQRNIENAVVMEKNENDEKVQNGVVAVEEWTPPLHAGENGGGIAIDAGRLSPAQGEEVKKGRRRHSFNEFVSNLISLHRSLPDVRDPECRSIQYPSDLPDASVVIIFHNEAWSTLLRTVHSVLDRSPQHLIKQIILVDDFSDMDHLQAPLDDYVSTLPKVSVIRSPSREGLIKARLLGLDHVTASVVVFLDSHCECAEGWLEPLLERVHADPTNVAVPIIDGINDETFEFSFMSARHAQVGTFTWALVFNWMQIPAHERARRKSVTEPIRSPTMAGGLFAIDVNYFHKLGTYDPGLKIWGGENLELSFKIWMCGGTLEVAPCSHVGHVFRKTSPHGSGGFPNFLAHNLNRVSAVWLDQYSFYSNRARRTQPKEKDIGDISERIELRRQLKCHSFGWYLKNVLPSMYLPADRIAHGMIQNRATNLCVASDVNRALLVNCRTRTRYRHSSNWYMNPGESTVFQEGPNMDTTCLDYAGQNPVQLDVRACHGLGGNQLWTYRTDTQQLLHHYSGLCLEASGPSSAVLLAMSRCDPASPRQRWDWDLSPIEGPSWRKDEAAGIPVL